MTDRELVARIARSAGQKAGYKQLVRELSLGGGRERRLLLEQLARLTARGALVKLDREHWSIPRPACALADARQPGRRAARSAPRRLRLCPAQSAVRRRSAPRKPRARKTFSFLPTRSTAPCRATRCWSKWSRPRPMDAAMGRIVRVLERRNPTVVGTFHYARSSTARREISSCPFDERMTQPF
jgi:ribonuclease R